MWIVLTKIFIRQLSNKVYILDQPAHLWSRFSRRPHRGTFWADMFYTSTFSKIFKSTPHRGTFSEGKSPFSDINLKNKPFKCSPKSEAIISEEISQLSTSLNIRLRLFINLKTMLDQNQKKVTSGNPRSCIKFGKSSIEKLKLAEAKAIAPSRPTENVCSTIESFGLKEKWKLVVGVVPQYWRVLYVYSRE